MNGKLRNFGVVALQTVAGPASNQMTEIVTYNLGKKPPTGTYVVTLNSLGLTDRAGNTLVETHFVTFPQTSNSPNPNYVAQFNVKKHLVAAGPIVYVPAGRTRRGLEVRRPDPHPSESSNDSTIDAFTF